ncbi:hypothetical protein [Enterococcus rotai]|uniref:hypothetical protein n=1 Tax=Enterococcus rotai TaxID=118060 RepID=UPI0035C6B227
MLIEQRVYRLLNGNSQLNQLMDQLRGKPFDENDGERTAIFQDDIEENFKKHELAPFLRMNPLEEKPYLHTDDEKKAEYQTIQIDWWCKNAEQSDLIKSMIDEILESNNFTQYYSDRYRDPDIKLRMNVRKYSYVEFKTEKERGKKHG